MTADARYKDPDFLEQKYTVEGLSLSRIGEICGRDPTTIRYWLQKHDIDTRDRGQQRLERASYGMNTHGYMVWQSFNTDDRSQDVFYVHRLLAIDEEGVEAVVANDIHHKNGIKWDNRPSNIDVMGHGDHASHHSKGRGAFSQFDKGLIASIYTQSDVTQEELGEIVGADQTYVSEMIGEAHEKIESWEPEGMPVEQFARFVDEELVPIATVLEEDSEAEGETEQETLEDDREQVNA